MLRRTEARTPSHLDQRFSGFLLSCRFVSLALCPSFLVFLVAVLTRSALRFPFCISLYTFVWLFYVSIASICAGYKSWRFVYTAVGCDAEKTTPRGRERARDGFGRFHGVLIEIYSNAWRKYTIRGDTLIEMEWHVANDGKPSACSCAYRIRSADVGDANKKQQKRWRTFRFGLYAKHKKSYFIKTNLKVAMNNLWRL